MKIHHARRFSRHCFCCASALRRRIGRARLRALSTPRASTRSAKPPAGTSRCRGTRPTVSYVIRKNNLAEIGRGTHHARQARRRSKRSSTSPAWCTSKSPRTRPARSRARSAQRWRPKRSAPSIPAPADFDAFWAAKIKALRKVPAKPELTDKPSEKDGVDFAILKMNHVDGQTRLGPGREAARPY